MLELKSRIKLHADYCHFPMDKIARKNKLSEEMRELQVALDRNMSDEIVPKLADVMITISLYCQVHGYDLDKIVRDKIEKNEERYK
jgi:NTP pyrophosphatase (non-canonical NTP hydrolase)